MNWIERYFFLYIPVASTTLLLILDFLFGGFFLPCEGRTHLYFSKCANSIRVKHHVYHHDLSKSFQGWDTWGHLRHEFCTDGSGFKTSCGSTQKLVRKFDIAFIGDSFTEGVGLKYEDSFVGQISAQLPSKKIANLGVSSYSPSIYFSKVNYLLEKGYQFGEVVVYIDISDIQDEAISYILDDKAVVSKGPGASKNSRLQKFKDLANWSFPLTYQGLHLLNTQYFTGKSEGEVSDTPQDYLSFAHTRSAWTYNPSTKGYGEGGVQDGINQSIKSMTRLSDLLNANGIALSVGVYPWPSQILYDQAQSKQVQIWRDFCKYRCKYFFNSFDSFFVLKASTSPDLVIENYFIAGDVHHNRQGARVIAEDFLKANKDWN